MGKNMFYIFKKGNKISTFKVIKSNKIQYLIFSRHPEYALYSFYDLKYALYSFYGVEYALYIFDAQLKLNHKSAIFRLMNLIIGVEVI